jgi:hypothetical protein
VKPETAFRTRHLDPFLLTLKNCYSQSIQQQGISGTSDKVICIHGRFVALEIKKSHKKADRPTKLQHYKLMLVEKSGGLSLVVSPDNWDEIKKLLTDMDMSKEYAWKQQSNQSSLFTKLYLE